MDATINAARLARATRRLARSKDAPFSIEALRERYSPARGGTARLARPEGAAPHPRGRGGNLGALATGGFSWKQRSLRPIL
jgi:hypothetical protein